CLQNPIDTAPSRDELTKLHQRAKLRARQDRGFTRAAWGIHRVSGMAPGSNRSRMARTNREGAKRTGTINHQNQGYIQQMRNMTGNVLWSSAGSSQRHATLNR